MHYLRKFFRNAYFEKTLDFCQFGKRNFWFVTAALIAVSLTLRFMLNSFTGFLQALILGIACWLLLSKLLLYNNDSNKRLLAMACLLLLFIKLGAVVLQTIYFPLPDEIAIYDKFAWKKTLEWMGGETIDLKILATTSTVTNYLYMISGLYFVFGHNFLTGKLFNIILSLFAGLFVYSAAKIFFGKKAALASFTAFSLFPSMTIWTVPLIRDSLAIFLIAGVFLYFAKFTLKRKIAYYLMPLVFLFGILETRVHVGAMAAIAVFVGLLYYLYLNKRTHFKIVVICIILVIFLSILLMQYDFSILSPLKLTPQDLNLYRSASAVGNLAFDQQLQMSTWSDVIAYAPKAVFYFLFSPFPLTLSGFFQKILSTIDVLFWYATFIAFIRSLPFAFRRMKKCAGIVAVIACIAALTIILSLIESNIGTIYRHRIQVEVLVLMLAGPGLVKIWAAVTRVLREKRQLFTRFIHSTNRYL